MNENCKKKSFTKVLFVKKLKKHDPTLLGTGCMYVYIWNTTEINTT